MSNETSDRKLTYKERLRKEFTGKGLLEMFLSALFMFVFIFGIRAYRDGMPDVKMTLLMVVVFVVVWPVMSWFWVTLGFIVDKVRADNVAQDDKGEIVAEEKTDGEVAKVKDEESVTLQASEESDKAGADRL